MIFEFGQYEVDVDVEKTKHFYESARIVSEGCSCDGCRNFEQAAAILPQSVRNFFTNLGVDVRKVSECYVNCTNEDGSLFYGGFYHVCGTLLSGESAWQNNSTEISYWNEEASAWQKNSVEISHWNEEAAFPVSDNFHVSFQNDVSLLETGFPLPVIQLEFLADIPWVLDKENTYP